MSKGRKKLREAVIDVQRAITSGLPSNNFLDASKPAV